jgi:hypothetical protein
LASNFEISSHFEVVELFVLEHVDGSSAISVGFLKVFSTTYWSNLSDGLFMGENIFLREFPSGRSVLNISSINWLIGTLIV